MSARPRVINVKRTAVSPRRYNAMYTYIHAEYSKKNLGVLSTGMAGRGIRMPRGRERIVARKRREFH